jgi:hypothetical protein
MISQYKNRCHARPYRSVFLCYYNAEALTVRLWLTGYPVPFHTEDIDSACRVCLGQAPRKHLLTAIK